MLGIEIDCHIVLLVRIQIDFTIDLTPSLQVTSMKLSEDHSKLPHPPLRRMSPLERHDLLRVDALPRSLLPPESRHLTRSPIRVISSGNKLLFTPKERSPLLPPSALQLGSAHSPSANVASILAKRSEPVPPSNFCPTPPPFMKDLSNQPLTSHIKKKPITKSRVFNLGSGTASSPRLELDKVLFLFLFFTIIQTFREKNINQS